MEADGFISFLGWGLFTYTWFGFNLMFFSLIADLIHDHNECIRQKAIEEYIENEDESEDENEDE